MSYQVYCYTELLKRIGTTAPSPPVDVLLVVNIVIKIFQADMALKYFNNLWHNPVLSCR